MSGQADVHDAGVWAAVAAMVLLAATAGFAQHGAAGGEWRTYGGDLGSTRYAPLDQITADNFDDLEVQWRFRTTNLGPFPDFNYQATPLMVDGVLYATAGSRRNVVAPRRGHRRAALDSPARRGPAGDERHPAPVGPRRRLLDRRRGRRAHLHRHHRLPARGARRPDGAAPAPLRRRRHRRPQARQRPAHRSPDRRDRVEQRPRRRPRRGHRRGLAPLRRVAPEPREREGVHPGLRRSDRRAPVDSSTPFHVPASSAARRG